MRRFVLIALLCLPALAEEESRDYEAEAEAIARQLASKDVDERMEGLRAAAANPETSLMRPLIRLLKAKNPSVRVAAVEALGLRQLKADRKRAASALAGRLKPLSRSAEAEQKEQKEELLKVIQSLHDLAQPVSIRALLSNIREDADRQVVRARAMAVGNVPSKDAIDRLLQFGSSGRRGRNRRDTTQAALRYATQENVRGGIDEWRKWWSDNRRTFDVDAAAEKRAEGSAKTAERANRKSKRRRKKSAGGS